jgi:hypothetical protein
MILQTIEPYKPDCPTLNLKPSICNEGISKIELLKLNSQQTVWLDCMANAGLSASKMVVKDS